MLTKSFSPADNRKVPPLKYDYVRRLVDNYPELTFSLNGGIETLYEAREQIEQCPDLAGVMVGRGLAADPWGFACADAVLYGDDDAIDGGDDRPRNRLELLEAYGRHADLEETLKDPIYIRRFITKAVSPLFAGEPNAKRFRIALDKIGGLPKRLRNKDGVEWVAGEGLRGQTKVSELILDAAREHLSEEVLRSTAEEGWERRQWEERKKRGKVILSKKIAREAPSTTTGTAEVERDAMLEWRRRRDEDRTTKEAIAEAEAETVDDDRESDAEEEHEAAEATTATSR